MHNQLKRIRIITRADHPEAQQLAKDIGLWLEERGIAVHISINIHENDRIGPEDVEDFGLPDLMLVLGGDGTFISAARDALGLCIPMLGINLGQVGFLTEISKDDWQEALEQVLSGNVTVEERMALTCQVLRKGELVHTGQAINDAVVGRGKMARLVTLSVTYGGEHISNVRADGLIISTPTGSTAYSVSAGGPLVHPGVDALSISPICPFRNYFRAMVLPAVQPLEIISEEPSSDVFLTEDGQKAVSLEQHDVIRVMPAPKGLLMVRFAGDSYFRTLVEKGFLKEV